MLKRTFSFFVAVALIFSCFALSSCEKQKEKYSKTSFELFDTVTTVTGYAESSEEFEMVSSFILDELEAYHRLFDIYKKSQQNICWDFLSFIDFFKFLLYFFAISQYLLRRGIF